MITFGIVGHNEEATVGGAIDQAMAAARRGDEVWFVDSASTDHSAALAREHGATVLAAPIGKGRAIAGLVTQCQTEFVCCIDADIIASQHNIPALLADEARRTDADLILGDFEDEPLAVLSNTMAVYDPMVAAIFPDVHGRCGSKPLTGFRAFRVDKIAGPLPPDFGIEAHLNIAFGTDAGAVMKVIALGTYKGRFRYKPAMGWEIANAILDLAQAKARVNPDERHLWVQWLEPIIAHIGEYRGQPERQATYRAELRHLKERPRPTEA